MRLTRRGLAVLIAAGLLYVAGELLGFPLLRAVAGVAVGAVLAALIAIARRPRVQVNRELYPIRIEAGRPALALLQVRNPGTGRQPGFIAKDVLSRDPLGHEVHVRELAPGASSTHRYQLPTEHRGRLVVGPLTLERRDPLGLARRWLVTGETATLWVHPRRHPVQPVQIAWPRHHHEGPGGPLTGSTDLRRVREYVVGDEVRHLHWKAMARTGTLMVREYADPAQPRFTVLIDNRVGVLPPAAMEHAVEVAASLAVAAMSAGHRTRLVSSCGDLDLESTGDLGAAREFLDQLAELDQSAGPLVLPGVAGGAVVFISGGAADPALLAQLGPALVVIDLNPGPRDVGRPREFRIIAASSASEAIRWWNGLVVR